MSGRLPLRRCGGGQSSIASPKVGIGSLAGVLLAKATNALLVSIRSQQIGAASTQATAELRSENVAAVGLPQSVPAERRIGDSYTFPIYAGGTRLKLFDCIALFLWRDRYDYDPTRGCPGEQNNIPCG